MAKRKVKTKENKAPKLNGAVFPMKATSKDIALAQIAVLDFFNLRKTKLSVEDLAKSGMIRKGNGDPYEYGTNKNSIYIAIAKDIAAGRSLYLTRPGTDQTEEFHKEPDSVLPMPHTPVDREFVDPIYRRAVLNDLQVIREKLEATGVRRKDSESFIALRNALEEKYQALENSAFKDEFKKNFEELTELAEKYRMEKIGQRATRTRTERVDGAKQLADLGEAVSQDKYLHEVVKTDMEKLRIQAAEKFVKSYALRRSKLQNNPAAVEEAKLLLSDPYAFREKVELALKQPFFQALYGGDDPRTAERLQAAATASPGEVFKAVSEESKNPIEKRMRYQEAMRSAPPVRLENYNKNLKISSELAADFTKQLLEVKAHLDSLGRVHRTSAEFQQLDRLLEIAKIRINSGAEFINYPRMAAEIGDAADRYFNFKMKDSDNYRSHQRVADAMKLRHIADAMNKGEKPSEAVPDKDTLNREIIQAKIVAQQAKLMLASKDPETQMEGKKLMTDPEAYKGAMKEIGSSDAFREYFGRMNGEELEKSAKLVRKELTANFVKKTVPISLKKPAVKAPEKAPKQKEAAQNKAFEL